MTTIMGLSLGRRDENLAGKTYHLRLWAKAQNLDRLDIKMRAMKWGLPPTWENDLWIPIGSLPKGTFDWQLFDFKVTLPDTRANYVLLHLQSQGDKNTKVWIDDMQGPPAPTHVQLSIAGSHEHAMDIPLSQDQSPDQQQDQQPTTITGDLAQRINNYLPHAPIDINGMRIVPIHININTTGIVRLSNPKLILVKSQAH